jgi:integrase
MYFMSPACPRGEWKGLEMAKTVAFTKAIIEGIAAPSTGRSWTHDRKVTGLSIMTTATGHKSYYWRRWTRHGSVKKRLGNVADLSIDQARRAAAEWNTKATLGEDLRPTARYKGNPTVGELWEQYLEGHAKAHKRTWSTDAATWEAKVANWAKGRRANEVTPGDVAKLHASIGAASGHYAANRALSLLSAVWSIGGRALGYAGPNPVKGVKRFKEEARERFLNEAEVKAFFLALSSESRDGQDFWRLLVLTGVRSGNLHAARWDEIDLERGVWTVPAAKSKNKKPMAVMLPEAAVIILRARLEQGDGDHEHVFKGGHWGPAQRSWERIRKRAGLKNARAHDLRRTLASWATIGGASLPVVGAMLGHRSASATSIYARLSESPVRAVVESTTRALMAAANGQSEESEQT